MDVWICVLIIFNTHFFCKYPLHFWGLWCKVSLHTEEMVDL